MMKKVVRQQKLSPSRYVRANKNCALFARWNGLVFVEMTDKEVRDECR